METSDRNEPKLRKIQENGQQEAYLVLSKEERDKGFVRPIRRTYIHNTCGCSTTMSLGIAETYARNPKFYSGTFCVNCGKHFNLVDQDGKRAFQWEDGTNVGE